MYTFNILIVVMVAFQILSLIQTGFIQNSFGYEVIKDLLELIIGGS